MPTNVDLPALGESVTEAVLLKWLKKDGDAVAAAEPICELETDKANVDLPAGVSGVLTRVKEEGDTVHIGETVARIDESAAGRPAAAKSDAAPASQPTGDGPAPAPAGNAMDELSPATRRVVAESGIDPSGITGTGRDGRLTKQDVEKSLAMKGSGGNGPAGAAVAEAEEPEASEPVPAAAPRGLPAAAVTKPIAPSAVTTPRPKPPTDQLAFDADGTKHVAMSKIRKRIAQTLVQVQHTAAILTTVNEVDLTAIIDLRTRYKERFQEVHGVGLGFMSFFCRAVVLAIREFPRVNAFIDGDDIIYHQYVHLGIAVSTDRGLAVPVVRNAHAMSFARIESEIKRLAAATRDGKLGLDELSGGTFSITNGGVYGSLLSTPIINPPQSAILGMHAIQKRPMAINDKVEIRSMMYVALSYDHRLVDGRESVSFLVRLKQFLEDPARLMLEI